MSGSSDVRFSELFEYTCRNFGILWAFKYYTKKHGMSEWEFDFWVNTVFA